MASNALFLSNALFGRIGRVHISRLFKKGLKELTSPACSVSPVLHCLTRQCANSRTGSTSRWLAFFLIAKEFKSMSNED